MTPDDPRHGTTRGYHAGCRDSCCRAAIAAYEKRGRTNRHRGVTRAVPAIGAQRRIQALMALGWTSADIAAAAGWRDRNRVLCILNGQKGKPTTWVQRGTHDTICDVFRRLAMRIPEHAPHRARTRTMARRKGYAPPLAWDNIDNPREKPKAEYKPREATSTRAAELLHLAHMGGNLEDACAELDLDRDALWVWCKRVGHLDLYERLAERSRKRENQYTTRSAVA